MKEREEKKGRLTVDHNLLGSEEPVEMHLDFIDDLPQEIVSQEGKITLFPLSSLFIKMRSFSGKWLVFVSVLSLP